jgi:aminopeptidase-like protein
MYSLIRRLYPVCRSLTGDGVRQTLAVLGELIDLEVREVPTGERVFDWTVPREWNIRDAWVADSSGRRVIDFRESNLHVVGYSRPVRERLTLEQLHPRLHSLPDRPDWIPYRTGYYADDWGFCVAHNVLQDLTDGEYEVCIDSSLTDGHLTYGEAYLPGAEENEILIHAHVCHPSMCNDNLSGIAVAAFLALRIAASARRYSYRFLFLPGTIGAITWLARNESRLSRISGGLVLSNAGDPGRLTYKCSRQGGAEVDRAARLVLTRRQGGGDVIDFSPFGYDERQYCSPGIDLPVGSLSRSSFGTYPEYHTSADDLRLVRADCLQDSLDATDEILQMMDQNRTYLNRSPKCEPQLGRRGLYDSLGGDADRRERELALLWVLNLSDGAHSLLDVAERSGVSFNGIRWAAEALLDADLLEEAPGPVLELRD